MSTPTPETGGITLDTDTLLDEIGRDHTRQWLETMQLRAGLRQQAARIAELEASIRGDGVDSS